MSFNGINYENEMKGEKFARVQSFTKKQNMNRFDNKYISTN